MLGRLKEVLRFFWVFLFAFCSHNPVLRNDRKFFDYQVFSYQLVSHDCKGVKCFFFFFRNLSKKPFPLLHLPMMRRNFNKFDNSDNHVQLNVILYGSRINSIEASYDVAVPKNCSEYVESFILKENMEI